MNILQRLEDRVSSGKWISVAVRLPESEGMYLIHAKSADPKKPFIVLAWHGSNGWELMPSAWISSITHWMPLPLPPKEA